MPLYVADALDAGERAAVRRHLAGGCGTCAGSLAEAQAAFAAVALGLDPIPPSPALLGRVMGRTDRATPPVATPPVATPPVATPPVANPPPAPWRILGPLAAAGLAAAVTLAAVSAWRPGHDARLVKPANDRAALLQFVLADQNATIDQLRQRLAEQQPLVDALRKPTTAVVSLAGAGQPTAAARLVWDAGGGHSILLTAGLAPPPAGRTYELWYIPAGRNPLRAATFTVGPAGSATVVAAIPADMPPLAQAAVSDEPIGGTDAPTGTIQLAGKVP